jgi:hypothetical protein
LDDTWRSNSEDKDLEEMSVFYFKVYIESFYCGEDNYVVLYTYIFFCAVCTRQHYGVTLPTLRTNEVSRWRHLSASLYDAKTQKNNITVLTASRTSDLTQWTSIGRHQKSEDGNSIFLRNIGIYRLVYTAPRARRTSSPTSRHYISIQLKELEENTEKTVRESRSL